MFILLCTHEIKSNPNKKKKKYPNIIKWVCMEHGKGDELYCGLYIRFYVNASFQVQSIVRGRDKTKLYLN